jgi:molybdopterin-containing oxidoreductase family iron-sulfur binding subunit
MEKCSFCIHRVRQANIRTSLEDRAIQEGEVVTACQQACPAGAIVFGNINDPNSAVSTARGNNRRYEMLAELSTKPRMSYLGRVMNPNPELERATA